MFRCGEPQLRSSRGSRGSDRSPARDSLAGPLAAEICASADTFLVHAGSRHWPPIERWFREAGCWPRRLVRCNSIPALIKMTVAGGGLSVLPVKAVVEEISAGLLQVVPSAAALPRNPFIIAYADRRLDAAAQIVIDTIKEVAATHMTDLAR